MLVQLIDLSHEPSVVFVVLFLLSLLASYILFKLLNSSATIKRKEWSAGGAIAGFILILFGSWYALRPSLNRRLQIVPLSIPTGFKTVSVSDVGLAIAIPPDWERKDAPTTLQFAAKHQEPNSDSAKFMLIQITPCGELPPMTSEADLPKFSSMIKELFGFMRLRGASVNDPYLGHKGSTEPASFSIPGRLLEPPQTADFVLNATVRHIFDERNGRCVLLVYPDNELGRQLSSTLNITDPLP